MSVKTKIGTFALVAGMSAMTACNNGGDFESTFETTVVSRSDLSTTVTATGTVEPVNSVDVGTQVSGIISKLYVDYNSVVTKGQVIAELDKSTLEADLLAGQATVASSEAEVKYQKANYERQKQLFEKKVISDTEMELAEYNYATAKAAYERNKADLIKLERNLGYATITSPVNGVVLYREVEEGQTVASSYSTPTLFTIAEDLRKMEVIADVDEADIGNVKDGQYVSFTVDAYPDDTFSGTVTQVRLQPTTESNVVTYEVVISVENDDLKLMPGMTATVTIVTGSAKNALSLPLQAFSFTPTFTGHDSIQAPPAPVLGKDSSIVFVKEGKFIRPVIVKTGMKAGTQKEILSGLAEGDTVVISQTAAINAPEKPSDTDKGGESNPFMPQPPGRRNRK